MVFLAGEQDIDCGMWTLEFSSTLMRADDNFPWFVYIRHVFLHAFVCHVGSGFTQLLLIIWQRARLLFLKETWKLSRTGQKGSCDTQIFQSKKNPVFVGNALCCLCRLWVFSFNDQGDFFWGGVILPRCLSLYVITSLCVALSRHLGVSHYPRTPKRSVCPPFFQSRLSWSSP